MKDFQGFTVPDGAYLPPELIYLLPGLSEKDVKILIVVIYHYAQFGGNEVSSLTDICYMTGLSRQSAVAGLKSLQKREMIERQGIGRSFAYSPRVKNLDSAEAKSLNFRPIDSLKFRLVKNLDHPEAEESERELINININSSLSDSLKLIGKLRSAGVYLKTAQALIANHPAEVIEQHLDFYRYALEKNLAQGPGWLVLSLKEGWPAPLGYVAKGGRERYAQWERVGLRDEEDADDED